MTEHKEKLVVAADAGNVKGIVEVLLSLRVNALQISPELRKNLVYELIRNDIFQLTTKLRNNFILDLLRYEDKAMRHALLALISVIVSTLKGVEYLISLDMSVMKRIIDILKQQEDGSVNQRFCIAILQKMSIKEDTIEFLLQQGLVQWIVELIERSKAKEIHVFSLDFSSALLANILHASATTEYLTKHPAFVREVNQLSCLLRVALGDNAKVVEGEDPDIRADAPVDMLVLPLKG